MNQYCPGEHAETLPVPAALDDRINVEEFDRKQFEKWFQRRTDVGLLHLFGKRRSVVLSCITAHNCS